MEKTQKKIAKKIWEIFIEKPRKKIRINAEKNHGKNRENNIEDFYGNIRETITRKKLEKLSKK